MEKQEIGWRFEESRSGDVDGLNNGDIDTFKSNHLLSLAKESAQNSLDAQVDKNQPVLLEFNTFYISQEDFPDISKYKEIINQQIKFWQITQNDKSAVNFFRNAREIINSDKIFCLRISDFNTSGLEGSRDGRDNILSNWWKLVRSKGVSDNDPLKGGSFGIGKHASFACSTIRTAFYSTKDTDGIEAYQGVSILASYDTSEGERTKGKGYYCNQQDFSCIEGPLHLDKEFHRTTPGTDIFIMGFVEEHRLRDEIFSSILSSFLLAIYNGNLKFKLNGETIEKSNLSDIIEEYKNSVYADLDYKEIIEDYEILEGNLNVSTYDFSIFEENDVALKVVLAPGLSRRIGMFRNNGMKIFDKKGIRLSSDFAGVLLLKGDKINGYFRKLENPKHDNWEPDRSHNPKEAEKTINKLFTFLRESLKELENKILPESENIEGIDSLPDEEIEEEGVESIEGLEFKPLKVRELNIIKKVRSKIKIPVGDGGRGKGKTPITNPGSGMGSSGPGKNKNKNSIIKVIPEKIKIFQDKNGEYNLFFVLMEKSESIKCEVFIGGEQFNESVEIKKASIVTNDVSRDLKFKGNEIELGTIENNSPIHIKFKLVEDDNWALEVNFYDN
jgi:hypothetical protein